MSQEIPKTYEPTDHEDSIYKEWEESGCFNPDACVEKGVTRSDAPAFSIVLPPPNATGTLHIGHAVMLAIEDILIRYHRMKGDRTLWLPGTDHAALATQEKVERILWDTEHKTRHDVGRDAFLERVDDFVEKSRNTMRWQMRKMGSSLDWSREAFTLDEARNQAVRIAFKKMFDDGIVYRGDRIVNWDPRMHTTVSDEEVERREEKAPFYYLQYGPFVIGTARPETKFGDKYVVVHPDDSRYEAYRHGQKIENINWINGRITATVIKDPSIDMSFGTGAMTITPCHDATDFDIAERHHLDKEPVIDFDGKLLPIAGEFAGMPIGEARKKIVEKLRAAGLIVRTDDEYIHNIATNSRGGGIIEPHIKRQWFIDVTKKFTRNGEQTSLKELLLTAVRSGKIAIIPERFEKIYFHWIDHLRDWCISRQIWYGHRIPVWYCETSTIENQHADEPCQRPIVSIETITACPHCKGPVAQDPDTLDTWFSSGLWTFSTLGWGSDEKRWGQEKQYHPTSVLETGSDILFFWVARMILMSEYLLEEAPFKTVYLHGLVRDKSGRKMSKSLGNVIDPLDIIPRLGTDAVRLSLVIGSTPGNDIRIGEEKIESYRNFTNKLWNIGRYVIQQPRHKTTEGSVPSVLSAADHWILSRLDKTVHEVTRLLEKYQFSLAGQALRDFTWNDFADWYVEIHKVEKNDQVLRHVFETLLTLWHPFMPFVTEALWSHLGKERLLMIEPWPKNTHSESQTARQDAPLSFSREKALEFEFFVREFVEKIRLARSMHRVPPSTRPLFILHETTQSGTKTAEHIKNILEIHAPLIQKLARLEDIVFGTETDEGIPVLFTHFSGRLALKREHADTKKERERLKKELEKLEVFIENTSSRLKNPSFTSKAPSEVIKNTETLLAESRQRHDNLRTALNGLDVRLEK